MTWTAASLTAAVAVAVFAAGIGRTAAAQDASPPFDAPNPAPTPASPRLFDQPVLSPKALDQPADAHPASADSGFAYAVNLGVASQYMLRGVDLTHNGVQGFIGADATYRQVYVGVWTSNVDLTSFGDRGTYDETDLWAGWRPSYAGFNLDIGGIFYGYLRQAADLDVFEGYVKASRMIGPLTAGVSLYASPDYAGIANGGYYAQGDVAYALTRRLTASAVIGHKGVDGPGRPPPPGTPSLFGHDGRFSYTTWNLGLAYALTDHLSLDLRYWDTDAHDYGGGAFRNRVVISAKAVFP